MEFTLITDPHISPKNLEKSDKLFKDIESFNNPVIWGGDLLDTKEIIRGKCLNFVYDKLKQSKLQHIILVGNHDWFNLDCQDHSLKVLSDLNNVQIIDSPTKLYDIWFIPYMNNKTELSKIVKSLKDKVVFIHQDVKGFDYGNGHISDDGIPVTTFKNCKRVIAGHFHKFQEKKNITYLGSPYSQSFGESNQQKYYGIYDYQTNKLELVPTNFPKHITTHIDCNLKEQSAKIVLNENNYNRVILEGTQENINKFDKSLFKNDSIKFIEKPSDGFLSATDIDETVDNIVQFKTWAEEIKNLDPETIKLGLDILEACNG